ncbi:MAG: hypothetical protein FD163_109 [Hyphomonadaceae bacterium]|nr:MAG: hypothetical protein FD128_1576 [Hyphomonadaceae bacterium]KAF0186834.1 MAG: hypothetical protein FD163_109 [Hyphomonadaceae bacterium]
MSIISPVSSRAIVPIRDKVTAVTAVEKANLNVDAPRINVYGAGTNNQDRAYNQAKTTHYGLNPLFAIHVLIEAGETGVENNIFAGALAYAHKLNMPQRLMAIA